MSKEVVEEVSSKFKFFRSKLAGLKTVVGGSKVDPTLVEYVRFTPVKEQFKGDTIFVGYLKTDNAIAIKNFENDPNVTEISADEWKKSTKVVDPKIVESEVTE